ncbi:MAG: hypothetical protein ACJ72L_13385 [Marmoricola sp.]
MEQQEQHTEQAPEHDTSRGDLAIATVMSTLVNTGYIFIAPGDQRILLLLMFSMVAGMIMLAGDKTAPYGMGIIFGVALAAVIAVVLALAGASPHGFVPNR